MKIIVAGGRDFDDYDLLCETLDDMFAGFAPEYMEVVSGGATGADSLGEKWADIYGFSVDKFPANWKEYGKAAGAIRNIEMAKVSDWLVAFWDGKSKGTKHMIDTALKHRLEIRVVFYDQG